MGFFGLFFKLKVGKGTNYFGSPSLAAGWGGCAALGCAQRVRALGWLPGESGGWGGVGGFGSSVAETGAPKPLDFARTSLHGILLPLCSL